MARQVSTSMPNGPWEGEAPHEDDVGLRYVVAAVGGEEQVAPPAGLDHLEQARLVNGQGLGVPGVNPRLVQVDDRDLDVGALVGYHSHGGACG